MERRKRIEALHMRKGIQKIIETIAGPYMRYITYRIENNTIVTGARDNAISAAENRMGRFLLVYKGEYSGSSYLSVYRHRDMTQKHLKSKSHSFPYFPIIHPPNPSAQRRFG